jgi:hypothetical protein
VYNLSKTYGGYIDDSEDSDFESFGFSLFSFALGVALVAAIKPSSAAMNNQDDRAADREAIRAHIDSIFQAFINRDSAKLRATHAENWLGYLEGYLGGSPMIKGIDSYMDWNQLDPKSAYGMKSYKFREFDIIFKGDAASVCSCRKSTR